ncbi:alpha-(1,3)-fucosyltransferase 9-like [Sphaeramia orbicularis]|uniref:alpha-(1,3)-fucosyltransferase 9-like n=1 Tax=Sphaeramia orbicularis TaxID=375764 RepID=UPI0011813F3A|nr:alpha-(1,3)-fucosyltransferase 9-like [Sphaeramia orbicularis]
MSSSTIQWNCLHFIIFISVFLLVLFTYYTSDISVPTFAFCTTSQKKSNCSCDDADPVNETPRTQTEPNTVVLIWTWPFGQRHDLSCRVFNITRCLLTDNRTLYHQAHGVLFHHRDINGNLDGFPNEPRPWFQKWVWWNMESPAHSSQIPALNHLFNLTCNYRYDSNIPVPYGYLVPVMSQDEVFKVPAKDKLVCWIVSNWRAHYERVQYYDKLKNYINVRAYGSPFGHHLTDQDYTTIISSCKFYLSFENSVYKDYITEKLYNPMRLGSVPVVLGPPRENYEDHIPGDAFIHVNDFASPKELAERLIYLDRNPDEYMNYFNWRNRFKVVNSWFGHEHACRTCSYLQRNRGYHVFHNLNKWYWG